MPLIMAIDSQDHKDKYLDTSKKILSQEITMCNIETLINILFLSCIMCIKGTI